MCSVCASCDLPTASARFQIPSLWPTSPYIQHPLQQCKVLFICSEHELIMPGRLPDTGLHFAVLAINIPSSCRHNQRGKQRSKSQQGDEEIRGSPTAKQRRDTFSPPPSPLQSDGLSLAGTQSRISPGYDGAYGFPCWACQNCPASSPVPLHLGLLLLPPFLPSLPPSLSLFRSSPHLTLPPPHNFSLLLSVATALSPTSPCLSKPLQLACFL